MLAILPGSSEPSALSIPRKRAGSRVRARSAASFGRPALSAARTALEDRGAVGVRPRDEGEADAGLGQLGGVGRVALGLGFLAQVVAPGRVHARRGRPEIEGHEQGSAASLEDVGDAPGLVGAGEQGVELELGRDLEGPLEVLLVVAPEDDRPPVADERDERLEPRVVGGPLQPGRVLGVLGLARGVIIGVDEALADVGDRAHEARRVAAPLGGEVDVQGHPVADDHGPDRLSVEVEEDALALEDAARRGDEHGGEAGPVEALDRRLIGLELVEDEEAGPRRKTVLGRRRLRRNGELRFGRLPAFGARRLFEEQVREGRDQSGISDEAFGFDDLRVPGDLDPVDGSQGLDEPVADDDRAFFDGRTGDRDDPAVADGVGRADVAGRNCGGERQDGRDREDEGSGDSRDGFHGPPLREVIYNKSRTRSNPEGTWSSRPVPSERTCFRSRGNLASAKTWSPLGAACRYLPHMI